MKLKIDFTQVVVLLKNNFNQKKNQKKNQK